MKLLDHHMHSDISFDSWELVENYLKLSENSIITTEHLDFQDPSGGYVDRIPDYVRHRKIAKELNDLYNNRVFVGIEVGWTEVSNDQILSFLDSKSYDLVLLSVHQNGHADYLEKDKFEGVSKQSIIEHYFNDLLKAVIAMKEHVDVLTHFDYGFRVHDVSVKDLEDHGRSVFESICALIIEHDIAFELNTSSMYKHKNLDLHSWAIPIYKSLGGSRFVLGSDAHSKYEYQRNFGDAVDYLKSLGVSEVVELYDGDVRFVSI